MPKIKMATMKKICIFLLIALSSNMAIAQVKQKTCEIYLKAIENESYPKLLKDKNDSLNLILCLKQQTNDTLNEDKMLRMSSIVKSIALATSQEDVEVAAVKFYIGNLSHKSSLVVDQAIISLRRFDRNLFDSTDIEKVAESINGKTLNLKDLFLLAGYLNKPILREKIKNIYQIGRKLTKSEIWAGNLALARMGDGSAIDFIIRRVEQLPTNSRAIESIYPDLIYTRQKKVFDQIIEKIYSDEPLCESPNPDSDKMMPCGYRIIELLAPVIDGFPLKTLPSGDLDVSSYPEALETARKWFKENKDDYQIINSSY